MAGVEEDHSEMKVTAGRGEQLLKYEKNLVDWPREVIAEQDCFKCIIICLPEQEKRGTGKN